MRKCLQLLPLILLVYSPAASAVGWKTQFNCANDYYAYCSKYAVGSADVRKCMRSNGPRLSKACVNALIADGEISRSEVDRIKERTAAAKAKVRDDPKVLAADTQKPKKKDTVQATLAIGRPSTPVAVPLVIDDPTYRALRKRARLLEDKADEVLLAREALDGDRSEKEPSPVEPLGNRAVITNGTRSVGVDELPPKAPAQAEKRGGVAPSETQKDRKPAVTEEAKIAAETESTAPGRPAASPASKMSLGRNNASNQADVPAPANGEAWDAYMQQPVQRRHELRRSWRSILQRALEPRSRGAVGLLVPVPVALSRLELSARSCGS